MVIDRKERNKILNQLKPIENTYKNHLRFRGKSRVQKEAPPSNKLLNYAYGQQNLFEVKEDKTLTK